MKGNIIVILVILFFLVFLTLLVWLGLLYIDACTAYLAVARAGGVTPRSYMTENQLAAENPPVFFVVRDEERGNL